MSSVRMCDRCGRIFSENEEDWSTFTGAVKRRDKTTGRAYTENATQDACPACSPGGSLLQPSLQPRVGEPAPRQITNGEADPARIAELERQELLTRVQSLEAQVSAQVDVPPPSVVRDEGVSHDPSYS